MPPINKKPTQSDETPDTLKPYTFHGIELDYRPSSKEALGTCPWCDSPKKFSVTVATGQWQCWKCSTGKGNGGNAATFIRKLFELSVLKTSESEYQTFAADRKLLFPQTLKDWGLCMSPFKKLWLAPGYNGEGKLCTLYRYTKLKMGDGTWKHRWLPTPTLGHHLFGRQLYNPSCQIVDICEGLSDGAALYELWKHSTLNGEKLVPSKNGECLKFRSVIATPGTKTFFETWIPLCAGRVVNIWYDNDRPITNALGTTIDPAGIDGAKRIASMLYQASEPPLEINYVNWGPEGFDPKLPNGYDLRDHLTS